jgi:hypothetical protein
MIRDGTLPKRYSASEKALEIAQEFQEMEDDAKLEHWEEERNEQL